MDPLTLTGFSWSAVHAVLAAMTFFGGSAFWVLWRLHRRLRTLEEGGDERNQALFGANDNPLHVGLAREAQRMKEDIDELDEEVADAAKDRRQMQKQLTRTEEKIDLVLEKLSE